MADEQTADPAEPVIEEGKELEYLRSQETEKEPPKEVPVKEEVKEEVKLEVKEEKRYVPYDALHEERMKRKELKERLDKQEQRFQDFIQRIPKDEPPQFENDTQRLAYDQQQLAKSVEEQKRFQDDQKKAQDQYRQTQNLVAAYAAKADEYSKAQPDFNEAYKFLLESRKNEYLAVGYSHEQVSEFLQADELAIVQKAFQDEANPAERIYKIAQTRGYTKKAEAKPNLENLEKGIKQNKTLASVSGASSKGLTLEAIADMSDEEFAKLDYAEIRRIAGQ